MVIDTLDPGRLARDLSILVDEIYAGIARAATVADAFSLYTVLRDHETDARVLTTAALKRADYLLKD